MNPIVLKIAGILVFMGKWGRILQERDARWAVFLKEAGSGEQDSHSVIVKNGFVRVCWTSAFPKARSYGWIKVAEKIRVLAALDSANEYTLRRGFARV